LQAIESVDDLKQAYSPGNWQQTLFEIVDRRYDPGYYILTHANDLSRLPMWVNSSSFQNLVLSTSTAVHEMNHLYGWELSGWDNYSYFLCPELIHHVPNINTPPRSVVYGMLDQTAGGMLMTYADLYLAGTMGSQGFWTLVDELNAYTHSIFTDYQLVDQLPMGTSISSLDGLSTFMLFTELYLKYVRENQAGQYNTIVNTAGVKETILDIWDRAEWIIDASADKKHRLSISAEPIMDRVNDLDNYAEIEMLRE